MANLFLFIACKICISVTRLDCLRRKTNSVIIKDNGRRLVIFSIDAKQSTIRDCQDILFYAKYVFPGYRIRIILNSIMTTDQIMEALNVTKTSL